LRSILTFSQKRKTPDPIPATKSTSHKHTEIAKMRYSYPMVYRSRVAKTTKKQPPASELSRRIDQSKTAGASQKEVFNTTELLENIISFLPPFEILTNAQSLLWLEGYHRRFAHSPNLGLAAPC
jgi:hypothetical protein